MEASVETSVKVASTEAFTETTSMKAFMEVAEAFMEASTDAISMEASAEASVKASGGNVSVEDFVESPEDPTDVSVEASVESPGSFYGLLRKKTIMQETVPSPCVRAFSSSFANLHFAFFVLFKSKSILKLTLF